MQKDFIFQSHVEHVIQGMKKEIREEFLLGPVDRLGGLVVIALARRAGDPGSIPGPGEIFFSYIIKKEICLLRP